MQLSDAGRLRVTSRTEWSGVGKVRVQCWVEGGAVVNAVGGIVAEILDEIGPQVRGRENGERTGYQWRVLFLENLETGQHKIILERINPKMPRVSASPHLDRKHPRLLWEPSRSQPTTARWFA